MSCFVFYTCSARPGAIAIPMHDGIDAFCRAILTGNDKNKPVAP